MPKRTQTHRVIPWAGGLNTALDPGLIPDTDLAIADNIVFSSSGARIKREGFDYFDSITIPATTKKASSGTTRSIVFASSIKTSGPTNEIFSVGEAVTIANAGASYDGNFVITSISTTDTTNDTINYTGVGSVTETVADTDIAVTRQYGISKVIDYWYYDTSAGAKDSVTIVATRQPRIYKYDDNGNRAILTAAAAAAEVTDVTLVTAADITTGDAFLLNAGGDTTQYYFWFNKGGGGGDPEISGRTGIEVITNTGETAIQVAQNVVDSIVGKEKYDITLPAAGSITTGQYFNIWSAANATAYYVWFNKDGGGGDPAPGGKTAIPVAIATGNTAPQVAAAVQAAIDASADFVATVASDVVTVTNAAVGTTTDAANVNVGGVFAIRKRANGGSAVTAWTTARNDAVVTFTTTATGVTTDGSNFSMDVLAGFEMEVTTQGRATETLSTADVAADMQVFNERLIISFEGANNRPIFYYPVTSTTTYFALGGNCPNFSIMSKHQGRLFVNEKTNKDRLHYSATFNPEQWNGDGDSGARDIERGDGDPGGITAIFPTFKGRLIVGKQTAIYQVIGETPDYYQIDTITKGLGVAGQQSVVPVDLDDILFISHRGVHSIVATINHGDFEGSFLSAKIQPTYNLFTRNILNRVAGVYVSDLNSVLFCVPDAENSSLNVVYGYNHMLKEWYRWPDMNVSAMCIRLNAALDRKMLFGRNDGRLIQGFNGDLDDFGTAIQYRIKSGAIYPGADPVGVKGFKKITLLYKPEGRFTFSARAQIDNFERQSLAFSQDTTGDELGVDFVLGASVLGINTVLAPFTQPIDGYGRGITIEIFSNSTTDAVEIYGLMIEYELAGDAQESNLGVSTGTI